MARKTAKQGHINRDEGMFKRLSLLLLCMAAGLTPAQAADYPAHAIKMVVPFAPGGGTDVFGRYINADVAKWSALVEEQGIVIPGAGK